MICLGLGRSEGFLSKKSAQRIPGDLDRVLGMAVAIEDGMGGFGIPNDTVIKLCNLDGPGIAQREPIPVEE